MAVQFIVGRSGSGKTTYCLQQIREILLKEPIGSPLILIVPEQATFQAEYELVTTPGLHGTIRAQVLSFRRLSYRILQPRQALIQAPLDEMGKKMLLYKLLQQLKNDLRSFHGSIQLAGFIEELQRFLDELIRYRITPIEFRRHIERHKERWMNTEPNLFKKLTDIEQVYMEYTTAMESRYTDAEHMLSFAADELFQSSLLDEAQIWIDGFHSFTPQERYMIEALMQKAKDVYITLCLDRPYAPDEQPHELNLFYEAALTMVQLRQQALACGVEEKTPYLLNPPQHVRFRNNPVLAHLEQHYDSRIVYTNKDDEENRVHEKTCIRLHPAANRRAEVEGVAREMIRLVREEGYRWRDFAILMRSLSDYSDLLSVLLEDYNIPYFLDEKREVIHHPLIEFIRSAIDVVRFNWRYEDVFRCVKTDLLLSLDDSHDEWDFVEVEKKLREQRHVLDQLENYVLAYGIQGKRWHDDHVWEMASKRIHGLDAARRKITEPLRSFERRIHQAKNVYQYVEALFYLFEEVGVQVHLSYWSARSLAEGNPEKAKEHAGIWDRIIDMIDQLIEIVGDEPITVESFSGLLDSGFESIRLGLFPPSLDQVLIGDMERSRPNSVRCCFVLGANDGILPKITLDGGVLSERERELFVQSGMELAPGGRRKLLAEQFLIYVTLTLPSDRLWISYPLADEEGRSLLPSEIVYRLKRMFPQLQETFLHGQPPPTEDAEDQLAYIAHPMRTLADLIVQIRRWYRGTAIDDVWWDVYHWYLDHFEWKDRLHRMLYGLFFTNRERNLPKTLSRQLYGQPLQASVTRLETFMACPFAHFISHGLRLQERKTYRLLAPDIGQLFHAALDHIASQLHSKGQKWSDLTVEQCYEEAERAVDMLSPHLQNEILQSSYRYAFIANKLKQIVGRASVVLSEHARRGEFVPVGLELEFGRNAKIPPLTFDLPNGDQLELRGRIDRVDVAYDQRGAYLRIIDYKSSQTNLDLADVYYGLSLQMLTYLNVVIMYAEKMIGQKALPAGVLYFHVHNPLIQKKNALDESEAERDWFKRFKMKGWLLSDAGVVQMMDRTLERGQSDIVPAGLRADGQFYKSSAVLSKEQWDTLLHYTRQLIRRIGEDILSGNVGIVPYRMPKKSACDYCVYRSICQFDPSYEQNEYRFLLERDEQILWDGIQKMNAPLLKEEGDEHVDG